MPFGNPAVATPWRRSPAAGGARCASASAARAGAPVDTRRRCARHGTRAVRSRAQLAARGRARCAGPRALARTAGLRRRTAPGACRWRRPAPGDRVPAIALALLRGVMRSCAEDCRPFLRPCAARYYEATVPCCPGRMRGACWREGDWWPPRCAIDRGVALRVRPGRCHCWTRALEATDTVSDQAVLLPDTRSGDTARHRAATARTLARWSTSRATDAPTTTGGASTGSGAASPPRCPTRSPPASAGAGDSGSPPDSAAEIAGLVHGGARCRIATPRSGRSSIACGWRLRSGSTRGRTCPGASQAARRRLPRCDTSGRAQVASARSAGARGSPRAHCRRGGKPTARRRAVGVEHVPALPEREGGGGVERGEEEEREPVAARRSGRQETRQDGRPRKRPGIAAAPRRARW
jgi:hypothetical protein